MMDSLKCTKFNTPMLQLIDVNALLTVLTTTLTTKDKFQRQSERESRKLIILIIFIDVCLNMNRKKGMCHKSYMKS